jgi:hypothetical protein
MFHFSDETTRSDMDFVIPIMHAIRPGSTREALNGAI